MKYDMTNRRRAADELYQSRAEEVEHLFGYGVPVKDVIERVGFPSASAAERYFQIRDRYDLSRPFGVIRGQQERARKRAAA